MTPETRKRLHLQAFEKGISFKRHCENILEDVAGTVIIEETIIRGKKSAEKPPKKGKFKDLPLTKEETPKVAEKPTGELDKSGKFDKKVQKGIYVNKAGTFQVRKLVIGEGVQYFYYGSIKEAQKALED
jgi:hypothetical protein